VQLEAFRTASPQPVLSGFAQALRNGIQVTVKVCAVNVVSALAFVLSGRREDLRWKRQVLEETMVALIDASYGYVDLADLQAAKDDKDLREYKERALDAHRVQLDALTRLRLLATPKVLKLAFDLHGIEDQLYNIVFTKSRDSAEWDELQKQRKQVRIELANTCRRNLGLWRTLPILPERSVGPSDEEITLHEMKRQRQDRELKSAQTVAEQVPNIQTVKVSRGWRLFRGRGAKELQRQ
jgi:hypothetical protein